MSYPWGFSVEQREAKAVYKSRLSRVLEFNIAATLDPELLRRRIHLASENDEAIGGGADVVKRETGDQGERSFGGWLQDLDIAWRDHSCGLDLVLKCAFAGFECDRVTSPNITQRPKESVAMAGQGDVALVARHGRLDDVPNCVT